MGEPHAETWERYRKDETSWIFTIARNTWRNEIRRLGTKKRDAAVVDLEQLQEVGWEPVAWEDDPEVKYLGKQRLSLLEERLRRLPPGMRRCFELRLAHGLKYREIALILKISIQSVRSQLHQARKRLEDLLSDR
jgi:RNA polymerase sigma-70 factor (ECF subfamily)